MALSIGQPLTFNDINDDMIKHILEKYVAERHVLSLLLCPFVSRRLASITTPILLNMSTVHINDLQKEPMTHYILYSTVSRRKALVICDCLSSPKSLLVVAVMDLYLNIRYVKMDVRDRSMLNNIDLCIKSNKTTGQIYKYIKKYYENK